MKQLEYIAIQGKVMFAHKHTVVDIKKLEGASRGCRVVYEDRPVAEIVRVG